MAQYKALVYLFLLCWPASLHNPSPETPNCRPCDKQPLSPALPCPVLAYTGPSKMDLPSHSKNGWETVTLPSVSISLPSSPQPNTPLVQYAACQWQVSKIHQAWQDKKAAGKVRNRISPNHHGIRMMHIPKTSHVKWKIFFSPPVSFFPPSHFLRWHCMGIPTPAQYT